MQAKNECHDPAFKRRTTQNANGICDFNSKQIANGICVFSANLQSQLLHLACCSDGTSHSMLKAPTVLALPTSCGLKSPSSLARPSRPRHVSSMHEVATPTCDLHTGYVQKQHPLGNSLERAPIWEKVCNSVPNWEICQVAMPMVLEVEMSMVVALIMWWWWLL